MINISRFLTTLAFSLIVFFVPLFLLADTPVKIEFWHSMAGEKGKLLSDIIHDFNQLPENKNRVVIQPQFVGTYEDGLNKLRTALIARKGPHVIQITDIGTKIMIDSKAITPLQDFINEDPEFPNTLILPAIRRYYETDGILYSLPFATSNPIIYYNSDLFQTVGVTSPPSTFAELEAVSEKLTDPKIRRAGLTWPLHSWIFEQFMAVQGATLINPGNGRQKAEKLEANYLSPESRRFIELWTRMAAKGSFANVGRGWDPAVHNFLAGRAAMLITSTSDIFEIVNQATFKVATAPLPGFEKKKTGGTIIGGNSLWIMKDKPESEQKQAYRFFKYMASADVQKRWHTNTGYFPIRSDVIDRLKAEGFYQKHPTAWTAIEQLNASPATHASQGALMGVFPEVREHVMNAIEEALSGKANTEEALTRAKTKTDFSLLRYGRGQARQNSPQP